jgi:membrane protein insertase Oxa1/YidC/SpoIIIJ
VQLYILKQAGSGEEADSAEVNAAVFRSMRFVFPVLVFVGSIGFAAALPLYWLSSGLFSWWQQDRVLKQDGQELEAEVLEVSSVQENNSKVIKTKTKSTSKTTIVVRTPETKRRHQMPKSAKSNKRSK